MPKADSDAKQTDGQLLGRQQKDGVAAGTVLAAAKGFAQAMASLAAGMELID